MNSSQFTLIKGKFPVIFSAPHSRLHYRPNLTGVHRDAEEFTDIVTLELGDKYMSSAITVNQPIDFDPNFHPLESNEYKSILLNNLKDTRPKALVDLHGLREDKNYDFGIYFSRRYLNSKKLAVTLADYISRSGPLKDVSFLFFNHPIGEGRGESISHFVASKLHIPAVQVEIAKYIREDPILRNSLIENLGAFSATL